jgi:hypothetical protein
MLQEIIIKIASPAATTVPQKSLVHSAKTFISAPARSTRATALGVRQWTEVRPDKRGSDHPAEGSRHEF